MTKLVKNKNILSAAILGAALLSGCNTMPKGTPVEAFQKSLEHSLDDTSYNFVIEQKFSLNKVSPKKAEEEAKAATVVDAAASVVLKTADECDEEFDNALQAGTGLSDEIEKKYLSCLKAAIGDDADNKSDAQKRPSNYLLNKVGDELSDKMSPERIKAIDSYLLKPLTSKILGAINTNTKQLQLDYLIEYRPKNFILSMKFPILLDFSDMSLTVDPAIALPILGPVFSEEIGTKWEGKRIKFTLPEQISEQLPTEVLLRALPKALIASYSAAPKDVFSYANVEDAMAKELNASSVVKMKLSTNQQLVLLDSFLSSWVKEIATVAEKNPDLIKDAKSFNAYLEMAKAMTEKGIFSSEMPLGELNDIDFLGSTETNFYLDNSGRAVAFLGKNNWSFLTEILNAELTSTVKTVVSNRNRAVFSFKPTKNNIIDGNALLAKYDDSNLFAKKANADTDDDTAVATAEAAADATAEVYAAEAVAEAATATAEAASDAATAVAEDAAAEAEVAAVVDAAMAATDEAESAVADEAVAGAMYDSNSNSQESESETIRQFCQNEAKNASKSALCQQDF